MGDKLKEKPTLIVHNELSEQVRIEIIQILKDVPLFSVSMMVESGAVETQHSSLD